MSTPRNSAEVAIKLFDVARSLGIAVKIESSLVSHSDSRYLILNPNTPNQAVIRISSHSPYDNERYGLALDIHKPKRLLSAVYVGEKWIRDYASHHHQIKSVAQRSGSTSADLPDDGGSRDGPTLGRKPNGWKRRNRHASHRLIPRDPGRLRDADQVSKRYGLKRYVRDELAGDD